MLTPAFTAIGLATSLGHDVVSAAAAARAGLVRPSVLDVALEDAASKDPQPVIGHPVSGLASGFHGVARLLRLVELAFSDLTTTVEVETLTSATWLMALPETVPAAPPLDAPEDADAPVEEYVEEPEPPRLAPDRLRAHLERLITSPLPPSRFLPFSGRVGLIRALGHAQRLAEQGTRCVVGAVDSLVTSDVLFRLHEHRRLLASNAGVGLEAGEAGVLFVVEPPDERPPLGRMGRGALSHEPDHAYTGRPALGRGLSDAVSKTDSEGTVWPVSDCNGELFRSMEWGQTIVRDASLRASSSHTLYPATSVGDTGTASPGVGAAFVLRAFQRGYAPAGDALLLSSDVLGPRAALHLLAP